MRVRARVRVTARIRVSVRVTAGLRAQGQGSRRPAHAGEAGRVEVLPPAALVQESHRRRAEELRLHVDLERLATLRGNVSARLGRG